jgi:hypothetical protein
MYYGNYVDIEEFVGKTFVSVENINDRELIFKTKDGFGFKMFHDQDCCEYVSIEDICGDLDDLVGNPILRAEEVTSRENPDGVDKEYQDSFTWTFYKIDTIKGGVTVRWYGESNGYYSESVDIARI